VFAVVLALGRVPAAPLTGHEPMQDKQQDRQQDRQQAGGERAAIASEWTAELTLRVKRVGAVQVSPDGQRVAYTVREPVMDDQRSHYLTHIYGSRVDGGDARPWTRGDHS